MPRRIVHVCPHTHWDREWYSPFQRYRMRLVRLMDRLLDLLESDPEYKVFTMDGQTIPVLDYLEIRPERRGQIEKLVRARKLLIGPWHILPDEFLVSGEAHIRNMMLGHRISAEFGFTPKIGYVPDTFGHLSQLPQFMRGFGIDNAMFFRGLSRPGGYKSELWWEGPDGSRVLGHYLHPLAGYSNAAPLPSDPERAERFMWALLRTWHDLGTTPHVLVHSGTDHCEARADIPALVRHFNERAAAQGEDIEFIQSSIPDYIDAVRESIDPDALETIGGELRSTNMNPYGGTGVILPNVLSSRIYNKIQNADAQQALERWAEPWSAFLWALGEEYPQAFLWKAWEWLIQNHPHDSIGGCSVDEVHAQMETRFQWAQEIADNLTDERMRLLAARLDLSWLQEDEFAVVVFNGLGFATNELVTADLDIPRGFLQRLAVNNAEHARRDWSDDDLFRPLWEREMHRRYQGDSPVMPTMRYKTLELRTRGGERLPAEIHDAKIAGQGMNLYDGPSGRQYFLRVRASFPAPELPACGCLVLAGRLLARPPKSDLPKHPHNIMENERLRVEIKPNGAFDLLDKTTGERFADQGYFEDGGDCGDGYNYSYPPHDEVFTTLSAQPRIARLSDGPVAQRYMIEYDLELPASLNEKRRRRRAERVRCPLAVYLTLAGDSPRLDIEIVFVNRALDHRLRMVFPSDIPAAVSHSESQFDVVEHAVHPIQPPPEAWREDQPVAYPQQTFVDVSLGGQRALCVMNHGLPEYELIDSPRREIVVTLLRAVGYLGGGTDLYTIAGGAGPNIETPGGQCLRTFHYRLAIMPHAGGWDEAEVWRQAHAFAVRPRAHVELKTPEVPICAQPVGPRLDWPDGRHSFLRIEGKNAILSAVKRAEGGEALIVRLFNPSATAAQAKVEFGWTIESAELVNLAEEGLGEGIPIESQRLTRLEIAPKRIVTLKCGIVRN